MKFFRFLSYVLLFGCAASLPAWAQSASTNMQVSRIAGPVDEANLVTLSGNVHPLATARFDRGAAPESMPTGRVTLVLERSAAQQQALTQYLADVQNPSSASFHQWLTPAQYGAAYGISDSDLQSVESWLSSHGFKIEKVPQGRNLVEFSGTVGQIESAFHISIHTFLVAGATHYANISDPQIPAALAPVVAGVGPLNDFHPAPPMAMGPRGHFDATTGRILPDLTLEDSGGQFLLFEDPADAATIYDVPNTNLNANYTSGTTYDGTGVTIGVAGVSNIPLADIENFRTAFLGETTTNVNLPTVIVDGNDPGLPGGGWEDEAILDNEVSGGMAPKAKVYFYTSADTDLSSGFPDAMFRALDDNAVSILSESIAECERDLGTAGNAQVLEASEQAAAQGITMVVASSDSGSAGCDNFDTASQAQYGFAVNGFASTPYEVAVGGTDYDSLPNAFSTWVNTTSSGTAPYYRTALKYIPENPWNDSTTLNATYATNSPSYNSEGQGNIVAGSGGLSTIYGKPSFQTSLTPGDSARDVPDVSMFAANGFYQAAWVFCSDNLADGVTTETYTECQNTNGQFSASTLFGGVGGTSAAAPAFAGILALVEQAQGGARLGQADSVLYQLAQSKYSTVFHDITSGNNSVPCVSGSPNCGSNGFLNGYNAGTGYDLATGLGSVDVKQLILNWSSVALHSTSTSLTIDGSAAAYTGVHGQSLTFNVGVTPAPTGNTEVVGIIDTANETSGGATSGPQNDGQFSIQLSSGAGSTTYKGLPGGTYTVSARYGGDTADASSTSTPISVTISPEASTTTLEVNAYNPVTGTGLSASSIPYGSEVVLDAQIEGTAEGASSQGTATGTVTFANGGTTLGTGSVTASSNQASWPPLTGNFVALAPGAYSVTAAYSGDPSYKASTSTATVLTVARAATTMAVSDPTTTVSLEAGGYATVTITTPYNAGAWPTGTVTMTASGNTIGSVNLAISTQGSGSSINWLLSGEGFINGFELAPGNNVVTLTYSGDTNYSGATNTLNIYNTSGVGSFTLSNGGNLTLTSGQTGNETITVSPTGGFTSPVTFYCSSTGPITCGNSSTNVSGTVPVSATLGATAAIGAAPGTYAVTVSGLNDTGKISASTTFNVIVNPLPTTAGVTITNGGPVSVAPGASGHADLTVTPVNGYLGDLNMICTIAATTSGETNLPTCSANGTITITSASPTYPSPAFFTTTSTSPGDYNVTVTVTDQINTAITASTQFVLTVSAPLVPSISLSSGGAINVTPGLAGSSTITVTPAGGFAGQVNLSCSLTTSPSGAADVPTCSIPSVDITTTAAASTTLTVSTKAGSSGALEPPLKRFFLGGGGAVLALVLFFGIPARRRAWRTVLSVIALVVVASAIGCSGGGGGGGGGGNSGTTAGAYVVTVTGTDAATGKITSSVTVNVTVN